MLKVLFVCVHNSARSQIAEAYLNKLGRGYFIAESAGLEPGELNPDIVKVMEEDGYDIKLNKTKSVFDFYLEGRRYHYVIKVCDQINGQRCPIFQATLDVLNWNHEDPASYVGNEEERLTKAREIRNQIKENVEHFINEQILGVISASCTNITNFYERKTEGNRGIQILALNNESFTTKFSELGVDRSWLLEPMIVHNGAWLETLANIWLIYFSEDILKNLNQTQFTREQLTGLMKYFYRLYPFNTDIRLQITKFALFACSLFEKKGLDLKIRERTISNHEDKLQIEHFIQDAVKDNSVLFWITSMFNSGIIIGYEINLSKIEFIYILAENSIEKVDFMKWFEMNQEGTQLIALKPQD